MDRIAMLKEILVGNPDDTFARYGLAMEYANSGQVETALAEFGVLLEKTPDYTAGYFMAAQTLTPISIEVLKARLTDDRRTTKFPTRAVQTKSR